MTANQEIFLGIVRNFLFPEKPLPDLELVNGKDWEEILYLAGIHSLLPVIFDAGAKSRSFQELPEQVRAGCRSEVMREITGQVRNTEQFLTLYRKILQAGMKPLVVKGIVCRNLYQKPDNRPSGDEDILIKRQDLEALDSLLKKEGFVSEEGKDGQTAQEISYYHSGSGFHLEVHMELFEASSDAYGRLNEEFQDIFEKTYAERIQGVTVYAPDPTLHLFYLVCHGLKHFLHTGFGIRQLCDMILFAQTYREDIRTKDFLQALKRQNMELFWDNLLDIGEKYLGFDWEKSSFPKPDKEALHSENMLLDMLDGGIYGKSSEGRMHSANITLQAGASDGKSSGILKSLFPDWEYMRRRYPYLEGRKWLLAYAWLCRITDYGKKKKGRGMQDAVRVGNRRVALLQEYGIIGNKDSGQDQG